MESVLELYRECYGDISFLHETVPSPAAPSTKASQEYIVPKGQQQKKETTTAVTAKQQQHQQQKLLDEWESINKFLTTHYKPLALAFFWILVPAILYVRDARINFPAEKRLYEMDVDTTFPAKSCPKDAECKEADVQTFIVQCFVSVMLGLFSALSWRDVFHVSKTFLFAGVQRWIAYVLISWVFLVIYLLAYMGDPALHQRVARAVLLAGKGMDSFTAAPLEFYDANFLVIQCSAAVALCLMGCVHHVASDASVKLELTILALIVAGLNIWALVHSPLTWINQYGCKKDVCLKHATDNLWVTYVGGIPRSNQVEWGQCAKATNRISYVTGNCVHVFLEPDWKNGNQFNDNVWRISTIIIVLRWFWQCARRKCSLAFHANLLCGLCTLVCLVALAIDHNTSPLFKAVIVFGLGQTGLLTEFGISNTILFEITKGATKSTELGRACFDAFISGLYCLSMIIISQLIASTTYSYEEKRVRRNLDEMTGDQIKKELKNAKGQADACEDALSNVIEPYLLAGFHYFAKNLIRVLCYQSLLLSYENTTFFVYAAYVMIGTKWHKLGPFELLNTCVLFFHAYAVCTDAKFFHLRFIS